MAIVTYPLDDIDYNYADVATYNSTRSSGVYGNDDFAATVTGTDNIITLDVGLAWMKISKFLGISVAMKTKTATDMGLPNTNYPRIDALILRFDANKNAVELVAKTGVAGSTPVAPEVVRTEAVYELHLYHVRREPGATAIAAKDVTDLRLDIKYCGIMADAITKVDTSAINNQVTELIEQLRESLEAVEDQTYYASKDYADNAAANALAEAKDYAEQKKLKFTDTPVPASAFAADTTYNDYPYRAAVALTGVTSTMIPEVVFPVSALVDTDFAPVAECYNGGVYIYAADKPTATVVIPTIICWR